MKEGWEGAVERVDSSYARLQAADAEEDRLMRELDEFLAAAPNRAEAERQAMRDLIPAIETARARAREAFEEWTRHVREMVEESTRSLDEGR